MEEEKNNDLNSNRPAPKPSGGEEEGLLRVPDGEGQDQAEMQWMREHHNASHALWYFSMIVYGAINGLSRQNNLQKTERILAHLSCLREFSGNTSKGSHKLVTRLFEALVAEKPSDSAKWLRFIYIHWNLISAFADCYGEQTRCFPEADFLKISDLLYGRQYARLWWWQIFLAKKIRQGKALAGAARSLGRTHA